jgi:hypothetical protein
MDLPHILLLAAAGVAALAVARALLATHPQPQADG